MNSFRIRYVRESLEKAGEVKQFYLSVYKKIAEMILLSKKNASLLSI